MVLQQFVDASQDERNDPGRECANDDARDNQPKRTGGKHDETWPGPVTQLLRLHFEGHTDGAFPGYTFVDTGVDGALPTAIGPLQGGSDAVLFFVGVEDVAATLAHAEQLGGRTIQPPQEVPGVTFGVFADPQGHVVGVAAN
jgi:predicted enzyme related to lactoylglutathione lyase